MAGGDSSAWPRRSSPTEDSTYRPSAWPSASRRSTCRASPSPEGRVTGVATTARRGQAPRSEQADVPEVTIITGLSGAGRSEAAKSFEDLGYFVVDNLPPALIGKMAELATIPGGPSRVAI